MREATQTRWPHGWHKEGFLVVTLATCAVFFRFGDRFYSALSNPLILTVLFLWLFGVIIGSALSVVRHAEHLAEMLGEPMGTLILTLSVTCIEVMSISAIMLHGDNNPTLLRDTVLSVIMIILNGMVGLSLLLGAFKHKEQSYNLQGANTYIGVIIPLVVLSVILPDYTQTTPGPTFSFMQETMLACLSIGLYCIFLAVQTGRHRDYFALHSEAPRESANAGPDHKARVRPLAFHAAMLAAYIIPIVYLAEHLAHPADYITETLHGPDAISGIMIALLVSTPEALGAVRAALANHLQRSINILLGSVLSSIGLTIPLMLVISHWTRHPIILGVEHADMVMLLLTLGLTIVTFASGRTNVLQGVVHLLLFVTYLLLVAQD